MIVPKSRRTYDPEFKQAKTTLKHYIFDATNLLNSIHQLSNHAQEISKFYLQFSTKVTSWYPHSTPAIRQSLQSINNSAESFDKITTDRFINSIVPNFERSMKEYKKQIDSIIILEKNRKKAVRSFDENRERLRKAQCAREPDNIKIDQLQRKVNECETTYNSANNDFISAVNEFTETRKESLVGLLKKCIFNLTEYINDVTQIPFIRFPDDPNSPPIVDSKTVTNHDDAVQHINQSQPILPPAAPINGQQLPIYVQNNYTQSTQTMTCYGNYQNQVPYQYYYNMQQNINQGPQYQNDSYDVQPYVVERAVSSNSSENKSNDDDDDDSSESYKSSDSDNSESDIDSNNDIINDELKKSN